MLLFSLSRVGVTLQVMGGRESSKGAKNKVEEGRYQTTSYQV